MTFPSQYPVTKNPQAGRIDILYSGWNDAIGGIMAFDPQHPVTRNPEAENLEITLYRTVNEDDPLHPQAVRYGATIADQWGHPMNHLHGDLLPHLTPAQVTAIIAFMDDMWALLEAAIP